MAFPNGIYYATDMPHTAHVYSIGNKLTTEIDYYIGHCINRLSGRSLLEVIFYFMPWYCFDMIWINMAQYIVGEHRENRIIFMPCKQLVITSDQQLIVIYFAIRKFKLWRQNMNNLNEELW